MKEIIDIIVSIIFNKSNTFENLFYLIVVALFISIVICLIISIILDPSTISFKKLS